MFYCLNCRIIKPFMPAYLYCNYFNMEQHTIHRRKFLKTGILSLGGILLSPTILNSKSKSKEYSYWIDIIEYARWAPSPHNMQPWKIEILSSKKATLYYNTERLLPAGDPDFKFMTMGMGIFIEYMNIAANKWGKHIEYTEKIEMLTDKQKGNIPFCSLEIKDGKMEKNIDPEAILKRKTSRLHYTGEAVPSYFMDILANEAKMHKSTLKYSANDELVDWLNSVNQQALFHDLKDKAVREELDNLFRYTNKEAEMIPDGLSAKCMGFPGKLLHSVMNEHERWTKGFRSKALKKLYKNSFNGTKTISWVSGEWNSAEDMMRAGKLFGRIWLLVTQSGYVLQPMGSLITNTEAHQQIKSKLGGENDKEVLWLIFRIGKSQEPPRSERYGTTHLTIEEINNEYKIES